MYPKKGTIMRLLRFSKGDVFLKAISAFGVAAFFHFLFGQWGGDMFAGPLFIVGLFFLAWWLQKVQRDRRLAQPNQFRVIREVRADYQQPPEVMSRGSRGLPTNFD